VAFHGWPAEALEFFEGLEVDNSKTYWTEHKAFYDGQVLQPMQELLTELAPQFGEGRVFRPYRDVRFSADKSPYKTNIAAHLPAGYLSLSARGLAAGRGMYVMATDQLERYRRAVDAERTGQELVALAAALRRKKIEVTGHEMLKSAPRGYAKDHPRVELLRHKGVVAWKEWPVAAWLGTKAAKERIAQFLAEAAALDEWLQRHVGPSTVEAAAAR